MLLCHSVLATVYIFPEQNTRNSATQNENENENDKTTLATLL